MTRRPWLVAVGAAALLTGLSACTGATGGTGLPQPTSGQNFIAGDDTVVQTAPADRGDPVAVSGTGVDGETIDTVDLRGQVVVLNTWFADCAPCRKEAPDLEKVSQDYAERGVRFVGINTYDSADRAQAFQRRFSVTYPSILDADSGHAMLALRGIAPTATPATVVLDAEGRVAAQISGVVGAVTLADVLDDAGAQPAPGSGA